MPDIKPIKRRPELRSLSREHHDGLLFVWKIRQGLERNVDTERLTAFVKWHFENHLVPHFQQEEMILFPYLPEHPLMIRMKAEHKLIRILINEIGTDPLREDLLELALVMEQHIRFEERELFQYLEEVLSAEDFSKIQQELEVSASENSCIVSWKDEFWVRDPSS